MATSSDPAIAMLGHRLLRLQTKETTTVLSPQQDSELNLPITQKIPIPPTLMRR